MATVVLDGDPLTLDGETVTFGEEAPSEPPAASADAPLELIWDGVEIGAVEYTASGEEVLGGIGRATVIVQDRENSTWEPEAHVSVVIRVRASGWVLFRGESLQPRVELPPGVPWRRWVIECRDYNSLLDERLAGAPDGSIFWRPTADDPYRPHDPNAVSGSTDEVTIGQWVDAYLLLPTAEAVDTTTHVHEYVDNTILGDPKYAIRAEEAMTTLGALVSQLASLADVNVQDWICPDKHWHHIEVPAWQELIGEPDPDWLEAAPYELWDLALDPDGTTAIGHGGIGVAKDGQTMPEVVYVQGATPAAIHDGINPDIVGGSGWYPAVPNRMQRQAYLSVPDAWEQTRRDTVAASAIRRAETETLRSTVRVTGWHGEARDGWRAGQLLKILDPRFPWSLEQAGRFVIQRVKWEQVAGADLRTYTLDFGDGAVSRASQRRVNTIEEVKPVKKPFITWVIDNLSIGDISADEVRDLVFTPVNGNGDPWGPPGVPVDFRVVAYDEDENVVPGEGSCSPSSTVTDDDGKARTTFTASSIPDLDYDIFAETDVAP